MRPIYKRVKVLAPHCPNCKEELSGNNSVAFPWECECGEWEIEELYPFNDPFNGEYVIKKTNL